MKDLNRNVISNPSSPPKPQFDRTVSSSLCATSASNASSFGGIASGRKVRGNRIGCLQSISGDAHHGRLIRLDASLLNQLRGHARGNSTSGLRKNSLGLRQQLDSVDDFRIEMHSAAQPPVSVISLRA